MYDDLPYQLLADLVLMLHFSVVAFVVGGLVLIFVGNLRGWRWVNALWFRLAHLGGIAVVIAEAWLGITCPLTTLEMGLRAQARATTYSGSFIEHWFSADALLRCSFLGFRGRLFTLWFARRGNMAAFSPDIQTPTQ